jgi:hypothetical protein
MIDIRRQQAGVLRLLGALALLGALVLGLAFSSPATALRQDPFMEVSKDKPLEERDFESPFVGSQSAAWNPHPQFCDHTNVNYLWTWCDAVGLLIDGPAEVSKDDSYVLRVTLSWENKVNDLNLRLWGCRNPPYRPGETYGNCASISGAETVDLNPEVLVTGDLPGNLYFLVPYQFAGENLAYTLKIEFLPAGFIPFTPPPKFIQRPRSTSPPATTEAQPSIFDEGVDEEQALERPEVKVPGADGEGSVRNLPLLNKGVASRIQQGGFGTLLIILVALFVAASILGVFFWRKRRIRDGAAEA